MSRVCGSRFSARQYSSPSMPGMSTSSTITSGLQRGDAARGHRGAVGLVELEIEDLERRPEQLPQAWIVVDQAASALRRCTPFAVSSALRRDATSIPLTG